MAATVLHVLSQRPGRTGSGVMLDALVRCAAEAGWDQHVVVGTPAEEPQPPVGGLPEERVRPLVFGSPALPFPLPGMSDVMPYASTRFSAMTPGQLDAYREAWRRHLRAVIAEVRPALVHSHHVWLLSALLKDVAPEVPVVTSCHATGLRQMALCPHLADEVGAGCARNDRFLVLHGGDRDAVVAQLGVEPRRVHLAGAGYNDAVFHDRERTAEPGPALLYAGKFSRAKGLPWLLDALERLAPRHPGLVLHVAGTGTGEEADALRQRMQRMAPRVQLHGQLSQPELAALMRRAAVFVLPSFYEGLPLVLVEAAACGCRLVSTALPGVSEQLARPLGEALIEVPPPRLLGADVPVPDDLPAFTARLETALESALARGPARSATDRVAAFTWSAVFARVEAVWRELVQE